MRYFELDKDYNQQIYAPNSELVARRYRQRSEASRQRFGAPLRYRYGLADAETVDIYPASFPANHHAPHSVGQAGPGPSVNALAPIHIFIHGGGWRLGQASDYGFLAETFLPAGVCLVIPNFASVLDTGGDLLHLVDQLRRLLVWAWHNGPGFGGDPGQIFLSGHSSGAHLAAVLLGTDWQGLYGLPPDAIKAGLLCSGTYEMEPLSRTFRSTFVDFSWQMQNALSPMRHPERLGMPLTLAWSVLETPGFIWQGQEFCQRLLQAGCQVQVIIDQEHNHFEIIECLADPASLLAQAALAQIFA